jgi:hypothetical protein
MRAGDKRSRAGEERGLLLPTAGRSTVLTPGTFKFRYASWDVPELDSLWGAVESSDGALRV